MGPTSTTPLQELTSISFSPLFAGSDLHLISPTGINFKLSSIFSSFELSLQDFLSLTSSFSTFSSSFSLSSSLSDAGTGDTGNLQRESADDRLCGADLHRISKRAFFGGDDEEFVVAGGTKTLVSSSFSSPDDSDFGSILTNAMGAGGGGASLSSAAVVSSAVFFLLQQQKNRHPPQEQIFFFFLFGKTLHKRACFKHQQRDLLVFGEVLSVFVLFLIFLRMRTWPMQVTLGEEGSPASLVG